MTLLLTSAVLGLLVGLSTGGRLSNLEMAHLRLAPLLILAVLVQNIAPMYLRGIMGLDDLQLVWAIWIPAALSASSVAVLNSRIRGMLIVAVGILMNVVVVGLNGGMPVALASLPISMQGAAERAIANSWLHLPMGGQTVMPLLADVVPVPGPQGFRGMASLGDMCLSVGVAMCLAALMHAGDARSATPQSGEGQGG